MLLKEVCILLLTLYCGIRFKGSIGLISCLGLLVCISMFHIQPCDPPFMIFLLILSIISTSSALYSVGGFEILSSIANKILVRFPAATTILVSIISFSFVYFTGSSYVILVILPMVEDIVLRMGLCPVKPLVASVIAANLSVISSPLSSPMLALVSILEPLGVSTMKILLISGISNFCGMLIGLPFIKVNKHHIYSSLSMTNKLSSGKSFSVKTTLSVGIFIIVVIVVAICGMCDQFRPSIVSNNQLIRLNTQVFTMMLMFGLTGIIMLINKQPFRAIYSQPVFISGIQAALSTFGITWLVNTIVNANKMTISGYLCKVVNCPIWLFGLIVILCSAIILSQTATILTILPIGLILGFTPLSLLIILPFVNGVILTSAYPTIQAAIDIDKTRALKNYHFLIPSIISILTASFIAYLLVQIL